MSEMIIVADENNTKYLGAHLIVTSLFESYKRKIKNTDNSEINDQKEKIECFTKVMKCLRLKMLGVSAVYKKKEDDLDVLMELTESMDLDSAIKDLIKKVKGDPKIIKVKGKSENLDCIKRELMNYSLICELLREDIVELVNDLVEKLKKETGETTKINCIKEIKKQLIKGLNDINLIIIEEEVINLAKEIKKLEVKNRTSVMNDIGDLMNKIKNNSIYRINDNISINLILNFEMEKKYE